MGPGTPGLDQLPPIEQYAVLTLNLDGGVGRAKLSLQGPEAPGIGVSGAIGVGRDAQGNYHFMIGGGEYVFPPKDIPGELRRLLGDAGGGNSAPPPSAVRMPNRDQLLRPDGSVMTYGDYELNRKLFHQEGLNVGGPTWPPLPRVLYEALTDFYFGPVHVELPPPSQDYGDYPVPAGSSRFA